MSNFSNYFSFEPKFGMGIHPGMVLTISTSNIFDLLRFELTTFYLGLESKKLKKTYLDNGIVML